MSQTYWCVFFSDLLFLFFSFPSILFSLLENSSLSLQTPVITNKSADSSPAETMIMMESSTCVCARACVFIKAALTLMAVEKCVEDRED